MNEKPSTSEQLETIKRHVQDVVEDMRSRNLLLPAIALIVAIVAALVVLPKKSEPVTEAVAPPPITQQASEERPIEILLVKPSAVGDDDVLTSSSNPFIGESDYTCKTISSGDPRILSCKIADLTVRVTCPMDADSPPCGSGEGASGEAGATGETAGGEAPGGGGLPGTQIVETPDPAPTTPPPAQKNPVVVYEYKTNLRYDGRAYNYVPAGTPLPTQKAPVVTLVKVDGKAKQATFKVELGSAVSGPKLDVRNQTFVLKTGRSAKITELSQAVHTLQLVAVKKVRKR